MMVQVPSSQWTGIVIYFLAIAGMSLSVTELLSVVAKQAIVLSLPYLNSPPKLSRIEQRRIDATLAVPPLPERSRTRVTALEAPSTSANIIAAQLDLAETEGLVEPTSPTDIASAKDGSLGPASQPSSIAVRVYGYEMTRFRRSRSNYAALSARDVFNRSFGVLSVAANY